jgi:hypothetical protein
LQVVETASLNFHFYFQFPDLSFGKPDIAVFSRKRIIWDMKNFSDIYKKPFFACAICVIYTAISLGVALFGF